jgi:hypothetical protein
MPDCRNIQDPIGRLGCTPLELSRLVHSDLGGEESKAQSVDQESLDLV